MRILFLITNLALESSKYVLVMTFTRLFADSEILMEI